ncbi:hypothetical protein BT69DRAFT_1282187 [Atractiella rhizophila]|nr:hypothetical protein BT69DRAFT_1282187 [Atractiella rhizophila]
MKLKSKKKASPPPTQARQCKICRGQWETSRNKFALCAGCSEFYHQLCHNPHILLNDEDPSLTFFCTSCDQKTAQEHPLSRYRHDDLISGEKFPIQDKREWLNLLPHQILIELILGLDATRQGLKLYPQNLEELVQSKKEEDRKRSAARAKLALDKLSKLRHSIEKQRKTGRKKREGPSIPGVALDTPAIPISSNTLPGYEDMIASAIKAINDPNGSPPRLIFEWMNDAYPLHKNFKASASQTLTKAVKRGRLTKSGSLYKLSDSWDEKTATTARGYRKPEAATEHPLNYVGEKSLLKPKEFYATPASMVAQASTSSSTQDSLGNSLDNSSAYPADSQEVKVNLADPLPPMETYTPNPGQTLFRADSPINALDRAIESILLSHPYLRASYDHGMGYNQEEAGEQENFQYEKMTNEEIERELAAFEDFLKIPVDDPNASSFPPPIDFQFPFPESQAQFPH